MVFCFTSAGCVLILETFLFWITGDEVPELLFPKGFKDFMTDHQKCRGTGKYNKFAKQMLLNRKAKL